MKPELQISSFDPRDFLKLPKEERQRLLSEQAKEVAGFYQPGHPHLEWTEEYVEDVANDSLSQTR
jgi:hypothetical protein